MDSCSAGLPLNPISGEAPGRTRPNGAQSQEALEAVPSPEYGNHLEAQEHRIPSVFVCVTGG